jgi:hypothetical protein
MVLRLKLLIFLIPAFLINLNLKAQRAGFNESLKYETVYDDPYDINKLYILIHPLYGEVFSTNTNIGFGLGLDYYLKEVIDFQLEFRTPYSKSTDFIHDAARKNNDALNTPERFYFIELGLNYHVVDRKESSKSEFVLYSKNFQQYNRWKTMVPESIFVPTNIRRIIGVRLGGTAYQSAFDFNKVIDNQGKSLSDISLSDINQLSFYSNIKSQGFYIGSSMELIKNIAINFEDLYDQNANDLIFTFFLDLLINPFITIEDISYLSEPEMQVETISAEIIDTNMLGFRGGIKGKYNRSIGFSYSVEIGMRPGIKGGGFYLMGVFSVPAFGFRLDKGQSSFID